MAFEMETGPENVVNIKVDGQAGAERLQRHL